MKQVTSLLLSAFACVFLLAGCASTSTTSDTTTTVTTTDLTSTCTNIQSALTVIAAVATVYDDGTAATITAASAVVADVCTSSSSSVSAASLATLAQTTIPDLITVVKSLSIDDTQKAVALAALAVAQVAVNAIITELDSSTTTSSAARAIIHPAALRIKAAKFRAGAK